MKVTISSTKEIVKDPRGFDCRVWLGETDSGLPVIFFVGSFSPAFEMSDPRFVEFSKEQKAISE